MTTPSTQMGCALDQLLIDYGHLLSSEHIEFIGAMIDKYESYGEDKPDEVFIEQILCATFNDIENVIEFLKLQNT